MASTRRRPPQCGQKGPGAGSAADRSSSMGRPVVWAMSRRMRSIETEQVGLKKIPDEVVKLKGLRILGLNGNELSGIADVKKLLPDL